MMSEKIEINTLITKHENKCKDCRFEMIDVEDLLWEYGSPLKRVLIDNETNETYDSVSELVGLLNEQQDNIDKQELRLQRLEELLELSENLNKSYKEKLIDMNLKMMKYDDE